MDPTTDATSKIQKSSSSRRRRVSRASAASSVADAEAPAEESSRQTGNRSRRKKAKGKLRSRRLPSSKGVAESPTAEEGLPSPVQTNTAGGAKEASQGKEDTHTGREGLGAPLHGTQTAWTMPADHGAVADHASSNSSSLPAVPFNLPPKVAVDEAAPLVPSAAGQSDSTTLVTTLQESQKRSADCFGTFQPTAAPSHAIRSKPRPPIARAFAPCTEMAVQDSSTIAHGFQRLYRGVR
ncbi:uncharacterized protein LOC142570672 [Dermacentor variabilis]|uniref:uncharacterized protein LOC142570672 n=1 Tax=Dermacentor variabilis TaxID=34621 RepID=UPI003F5C6903